MIFRRKFDDDELDAAPTGDADLALEVAQLREEVRADDVRQPVDLLQR